eukprot:2101819-Amphidinium_carterae.1
MAMPACPGWSSGLRVGDLSARPQSIPVRAQSCPRKFHSEFRLPACFPVCDNRESSLDLENSNPYTTALTATPLPQLSSIALRRA